MKIGLQAWGSDGDVRPMLALAGGLRRAGHRVTLAVTSIGDKDYAPWARRLGVDLLPVASLPADQRRQRHDAALLRERNPLRQLRMIFDESLVPILDEIWEAGVGLCRESDLVIGPFVLYPLYVAAEKVGVPYVSVTYTHNLPSRRITPVGLPNWGPWINPLWWKLARRLVDRETRPHVNDLRRRAGLPRLTRVDLLPASDLDLIAVSGAVCRRQSDWHPRHRVCGAFEMPADGEAWDVPEAVERFLRRGPAPVYLTFGSMLPALEESAALLAEAVELAGCRAILQGASSGANLELGENLLTVGHLPHDRIFPRCAAVAHHGGSGTSQATLRAGRPSVVVPHMTDQFFWGHELRRVGVAPRPLPVRRLTAGRLAATLRQVLESPAMAARAEYLGEIVRRERGVATAVRWIEQTFGDGRRRPAPPPPPILGDRGEGERWPVRQVG